MASSPPASPGTHLQQRPMSAMVRPSQRSSSRLSTTSRQGGGSKASDEDSRTAVKVAVRVRPPLNPNDPGYELIPQRFQRSMVQVTSDTSLAIDSPQGRKLFVFDRVFGSDVNQEGVWDYLNDCVTAFVQGYNVSLLAYGQSGAGKSYTMGTSGPSEQGDTEMMGVIPRAATALFERLDGTTKKQTNRSSMSHLRAPARYSSPASLPPSEKNWSLKATYLEIYNEQLRDLLIPDHVPPHERGAVTIREDVKGNIILTGLQQVEINSVEDLMNALEFGSTLRQTDATAINARSSRSHAVFSLNLVQRKSGLQGSNGADKRCSVPIEAMTGSETWVTTDSKLHFVDLAGSERLKNTGAQGERAKEGISINAGLAALGKVISQLSSRQAGSHVSYRDSKLTRLLQDSLGGNAITYMIACVTPAEFHLSETLNTVQYAQRARAIQSKPRIQQVEEGDKQAIIDRLKAEVAFLREQVRSAERGGGERRMVSIGDRSERHNERENDLQNQLLDAQENYTALSQRHAKLIAEMAKARDNEAAENDQHEESMGDTATERLNRSNSFAAAVEQVVLEYEKTIQTLEQSLTSTRGTLASTEASLLEKETKCTYVETINTQLQARLQKLMDREASTENYLHDLESKLDGHTSGEEKNATIVMELRKEIARVRENEASCEDYISTLEERLAEADQDAELMQREIDRLEQVIERQRSLGKLDSLLHELDHIQADSKVPEPVAEAPNGVVRANGDHGRNQSLSRISRMSQNDVIPENVEGEAAATAEATHSAHVRRQGGNGSTSAETSNTRERNLAADNYDYLPQSPAQSKFVQDKLENVTQELIDLRVEHETTVNEYDLLHAKYEEALRTLADLQDTIDESRHPERKVRDSMMSLTSPTRTRPPSFFSDARSSGIKDGGQFSSRSLSSELSSALDSPAMLDPSDAETAGTAKPTSTEDLLHQDLLAAEVERFKILAAEKEDAERELAERYIQLEHEHHEALDMLEELKTEVAQARAFDASSPRTSQPVIRRKSSQNVMIIDRAHRSFASLRNIAAENFEGQPDVMQNFELNLHAAMHELHARSERVQELEADVASAKKEMETKMALISGLTRERSSLQASPMDMSMVSNLKNQLEANEQQMAAMRESHEATERRLLAEIESLRASLNGARTQEDAAAAAETLAATAAAGAVADVPAASTELTRTWPAAVDNDKKITELQAELSTWETKHQTALDTLQETEAKMKMTIEELESEIKSLNAKVAEQSSSAHDGEGVKDVEVKHETLLQSLREEIDEYRLAINTNASKVSDLEAAHAAAKAELEEVVRARDLHETQAKTQHSLITNLENQIAAHEQALKTHQDGMKLLQENHARELEEMRQAEQKGYEEQVAVLLNEHAENIRALEGELNDTREDLMKVATQVAYALGTDVSIGKLTERIDDLIAGQKAFGEAQKKSAEAEMHVVELAAINDNLLRELEQAKSTLSDILIAEGDAVASPIPLPAQLSAVRKKISDLESRNKKNSRLVEELEDQLQSNFDEVQMTNNRLSTLQTERNVQIEEAQAAKSRAESELDSLRAEYAALQARIDEASNFGQVQQSDPNAGLRKSASVSSLPSPPPAIPLPPLPGGGGGGNNASGPNGTVPSTPTQGGRPASKDNMGSINQIQEDQEARIRTIEKHLQAEKQLTQTLEEALTDLERQSNKVKADGDAWRKRCAELEMEIKELKDRPAPTPQPDNRWSLHAVEEERKKRQAAEAQQRLLEERMNALSKKKKKGSLNCF
ncbi:kinesin motor domain-containing protein [Colletotrichum falcatum]|nr:kinesin motor domain-containing protein [Colletotrichum falcatum]